ncbi:MAG: hypothetical protein EPO08_06135 [Rhodospirillaceae bacterium]|nr:MAG: hypothetical protein EPO08_06135 [Rhodospirillaceae bacterium]
MRRLVLYAVSVLLVSSGSYAQSVSSTGANIRSDVNSHQLNGAGVWAWGDGTFGQLGDPSLPARKPSQFENPFNEKMFDALQKENELTRQEIQWRAEPRTIENIPDAVDISAGQAMSCAVVRSGDVYCWGGGSNSPTKVPAITEAMQVSVGGNHACAVTQHKAIYCWGSNDSGEIGNGSIGGRVDIPTPISKYSGFVAVTSGDKHSCGLLENHRIVCWGADWGTGSAGWQVDGGFYQGKARPEPRIIPGLFHVAKVAAGHELTCALLENGQVICWGSELYGGIGHHGYADFGPSLVWSVEGAVDVAVGFHSVCAVLKTGMIRCWGDNTGGKLGIGTSRDSNGLDVDAEAIGPVHKISNAVSVAVGWMMACALTREGTVYCWGDNALGEIGSAGRQVFEPKLVPGLVGVDQIAAGHSHILALIRAKP